MSIASELNKLVQIFKNWTPSTNIPPATANTLGGVKVGDGLEVTEDGTLSAQASGGEGTFIFKMQDEEDETVYTLVSAPCTVAEFTERAQTGGLPYRVALRWKDLAEKIHCTEMIASEITTDDDGPFQLSHIFWTSVSDSLYKLDVNNGEFRLTDYNPPM